MVFALLAIALSCAALVAGVIAAVLAFITHEEADSAETDADRAYRWREEMRAKSHERWRR